MKSTITFIFLVHLTLLVSCTKRAEQGSRATLPEIDISGSPDGIVPLPENVPAVFRKYFVKYTKIMAPNGKPIHFLAQDGWSDDQIKHGRDVLEHILTSYPGSVYGAEKTQVANAMADRKATMVFFNTEPDLRKAFSEGLGVATDLSMQDLRANECTPVGSPDYMQHITRDASYEEIWHLVHDYGIKPTLPAMLAEMRRANDAAARKGWRAWPEDEPEEHPNEYVGVLLDNYYDLWAVRPQKYEGRIIGIDDIPEGQSHFGRYFANSRARLKQEDPPGFALVEKFFHPYLTYTPELPRDFTGTFSMQFYLLQVYTYKSQHLVNVTLTGDNDANLVGNAYDNILTGNAGNNVLNGGPGNDTLRGNEGQDTAVFSGAYSDYTIKREGEEVSVRDKVANRDGVDTLSQVELLKFSDQIVNL